MGQNRKMGKKIWDVGSNKVVNIRLKCKVMWMTAERTEDGWPFVDL